MQKIEKDDSYDSIVYDVEEEFKLYKGIMNQKIGRKNLVLSREISKKKKIINRLFRDRFGKNFIPIKLESLKAFESFVRYYLFSPQSEILKRFPKLKKQILHERDINYNELRNRINMGSLLYLSLSGSGTSKNKNINEKFFQISKNLTTTISKDTISNQVYNVKFLKKNTERINKILAYKAEKNKEKELTNINEEKNYVKTQTAFFKNKKDKYKGRNFSIKDFDNKKTSLNKVPYNTYENFYQNNNELNNVENKYQNLGKDNNNSLKYFNLLKQSHNLKFNSVAKYNSRNTGTNFVKLEGLTTTNATNGNNDYSTKSFSPFSTFSNFHKKNNFKLIKRTKNFQNDINKYVQNLNNQTSSCNNKLIKIINSNKNKQIKTAEEENQEVINLKNILLDKKQKKKKKINNLKQIKGLIQKAILDSEGEANLEKIKKKELKKLGKHLNEMNNEFALYKVNELYSKAQLKRQGKNFAQEELERIRKKKFREIKVFRSRKNAKINYLKMIKMKTDLALIKDKFEKTDISTTNRTLEINNKIRNIKNNM